MVERQIIYAGNFKLFPADAAGRRVLALASGLHESGHHVVLYPRIGKTPIWGVPFTKGTNYDERLAGGRSFSHLLFSITLIKTKINAVILYNPSNLQSILVLLLSIFNRYNKVLDITEWYEYKHLPSLAARIEVFLRMNLVYRLFKRMILISDYLYEFYRPPIGCVIPALVGEDTPVTNAKTSVEGSGPLRILYAGFPGRKDRIDLLTSWLGDVDIGRPIELYLAGPSSEQVPPSVTSELRLKVIALGPITRREVFSLYGRCHLSAIIRDNARYEWAGFPTKAVESWSVAVPTLILSHSKFARVARQYGAVVDINANDPVRSLESVLKGICTSGAEFTKMSLAALNLARDRHQITNYVLALNEVVT